MLAGKIAQVVVSALSRARSSLRRFGMMATAAACLCAAPAVAGPQSYVVGSDHGGYLSDRLAELAQLQRRGARVEIRGQVCYSTCTMFLGLPGTCVNPNTEFGFHGPSRNGRRLAQQDFEYFSRVIADYYPEPLRNWFMREGRNRISGIHRIKGQEIIRMGVPACRRA